MNKDYPLHRKKSVHLWVAMTLSIWVYVFLFFSEPFDINRFSQNEKIWLLPCFGLLAGISYYIPLFYQYKILNKKNHWNIKNEITFVGLVVFIGAFFFYFFYKNFVAEYEPGTYNFFDYLKKVYLPAIVIILPLLMISRYIIAKYSEGKSSNSKILIKGKGQYDFIKLELEDLLFVQSSNNYIDVYFLEHKTLQKKVIRSTIAEVAMLLPNLVKIHRSFLINPSHFKQFKTENKKWFVDVGHGFVLPVSRGLQNSVKEILQFAPNK